ncbi:SDR family oxidoreductase [Nonomuraea sp. NPDC050663]|uniref:SDR family oxidoreductase n=1 Tax=Nonomuraea sp. NPDC050663 TaxID=3364370 RepID=UPI0037884942
MNKRTAVITGASSGIGAAIARKLAAQGAGVALVARRKDRLDALREELGGEVVAVAADLSRQEEVAAMARQVSETLGRVDLVVNAAGILLPGMLDGEEAPAEWRSQLDLNVSGLLHVFRAFLPDLQAAAADGGSADLVNISSISASRIEPGAAVYAATKAAVSHLSRNMRNELAPHSIRVTNVEPGVVATELLSGSELGVAWLKDMKTRIDPLEAADLAEVVVFAVSRPAHVSLPELTVMPTRQV